MAREANISGHPVYQYEYHGSAAIRQSVTFLSTTVPCCHGEDIIISEKKGKKLELNFNEIKEKIEELTK